MLQETQGIIEKGKEEYKRIGMGLRRNAKYRKLRNFGFISRASGCHTAEYGKIMAFLREKFLAALLAS